MLPTPLRALALATLAALSVSAVHLPDALADCQCPIFDPCHVNHRCEGDTCVADPRNCSTSDVCNPGYCDGQIGCVTTPFCPQDASICNGVEYCQAIPIPVNGGLVFLPFCLRTPPISCDDNNACTNDSPCTDGPVLCTHTPVNCNTGDPCSIDSCLPQSGCTHFMKDIPAECCRNDADCAPGDQCVIRKCIGNRCTDTGPRDCDDVDTCTVDSCDPDTGCVHDPAPGCGTSNPTGCRRDDDCATRCATGRTCTDGACSAGTPTVCDDGEPCTIDSCDPASGCIGVARTGFDALACVCERTEPPECTDQSVPKIVTKRLDRGCTAVSRAASASGRKRTKLIKRAAGLFMTASKKAAKLAGHKGFGVDCGHTLAARFADNHSRAITVGGEQ